MSRPTTAVPSKLPHILPYILIIASLVSLASALILGKDKLALLENAHTTLNCNLDPVLSCSNVIATPQAAVFGFPNPWIGFAAFSVFITVGVMMLAGAQLKRWFWIAFEVGMILAMIFAYWLLTQSIFVIGALCPYCLVVDVMVTTMFWYLTLHVFEQGYVNMPARLARLSTFARRHHVEILITWFLLIVALILQHFWYYYGQVL